MPGAHLTEVTTLSGESDVSWTNTAVTGETALMFLAVCLMSFIVEFVCVTCVYVCFSQDLFSERNI